MLTALLALLNAIPGISSLVNGVVKSVFDAKVQIVQAKTGADKEVAVELVKKAAAEAHERTEALAIIASNYLLTLLVLAFAIPLVAYEWWVIIHDKLWCAGQCKTDPIGGQVGDWAQMIIAFIFGAPAAVSLGKMWFARKTD